MLNRIYEDIILEHFQNNTQMLFLAGPRQVGKTTLAQKISAQWSYHVYLNWDDVDDRDLILSGQKQLAETKGITTLKDQKTLLIFDEIHKYPQWKNYLKGFYDKYKDLVNIMVTGSAQLDAMRKGGDSLMGRYFIMRIHPLSVRECIDTHFSGSLITAPQCLSAKKFHALKHYGGFPDPFIKADSRFYRQWSQTREQQLLREDVRDLSRIQELAHLAVLTTLLKNHSGKFINYTALANAVGVSNETIRQWVVLLEGFYFCFTLKPYTKNVSRSLRKNPKVYLWDWSQVTDAGSRNENMLASHLLKAVHLWTDCGFGNFELYYIRDKDKREVDFVVVRDEKPWILLEAKSNDNARISQSLAYYHKILKTEYAFQVALNLDYTDQDCFKFKMPLIVPGVTLLSQLI